MSYFLYGYKRHYPIVYVCYVFVVDQIVGVFRLVLFVDDEDVVHTADLPKRLTVLTVQFRVLYLQFQSIYSEVRFKNKYSKRGGIKLIAIFFTIWCE